MNKTLFTAGGTVIQLGAEMGVGGEGAVFDVPSRPKQVAKVYHAKHLPAPQKAAKLAFMASTADDLLLSYAAWPQDTLHSSKGGPMVGFLMPKVSGKAPVHMVYSPAHRRQDRPKAAWDFLLFVARNTAAAFDVLHRHGHVLGDVNQGNVLVGDDSKVVLIDSDSFQVDARGTLHYCEVGVSHFTPPELQGLSSFKGFKRTANHDNFGLALLIFHLLFGGRHPYSGVPLRDGVGESLEGDIKAFRFAYARDARNRGFQPPPRTIPLSLVPKPMEDMFYTAFTEQGTAKRPIAADWMHALDDLRQKLTKCSTSPAHVYPNHQSTCPWCALERDGVLYFVYLASTKIPTSSGFVLAQVWGLIEAVQPPPAIVIPNVTSAGLKPTPLPGNIRSKRSISVYKALVIILAVGLTVAFPMAWLLTVIGGFVAYSKVVSSANGKCEAENTRRRKTLSNAEYELEALVEQLKKDAGPEVFRQKKQELKTYRHEYEQLPNREKQELTALTAGAEARQREKFLQTCFIDIADISGLGPSRKTALRSFGIETAADVTKSRVMQVQGFGESRTRAVLDWRASCERRFRFNPATAVTAADQNAVKLRIHQRRVALEGLLKNGAAVLKSCQEAAVRKISEAQFKLTSLATDVEQARLDVTVIA
ncbi:hypothetical protein Tamer19_06850 [Cupriavidus sp. TA19]|uniref:helix-hairpin-helix domain-containing protein n=1 Tax=unclassified Cupriavidus TaxID=2640874 RepID=UPI000E2EE7A6|nr:MULTISPECIES: helix-hairpin-helix domain-containing protein [unclassified Cupriavidus]BDB29446.1 helix-hairpin-helix domain-containing protein [Cupriavidus sp. P-10]GLC91277.1 hypothetical protein Tamer19_06850 [Cupriavidus sp. TA19]